MFIEAGVSIAALRVPLNPPTLLPIDYEISSRFLRGSVILQPELAGSIKTTNQGMNTESPSLSNLLDSQTRRPGYARRSSIPIKPMQCEYHMSMRFFLAMLLAIILTQRLDAQTSTDELATTLDKILQRLDAIELRIRQFEDRDDKQPTTDSVVGRILLPDIAVESLASHFDALRVACDDPSLFLGIDKQTNMLLFIASPDACDQTDQSIRKWISDAKNAGLLVSLDGSPAPQRPSVDPYLPTQRQIKIRTDELKRLFPRRYWTLDEPRIERESASPIDLLNDQLREPR